ncbi:MAG: sodium:proton antiporter NhaD [Bacteroidaceae bacterium]|nr:sodium:proton antiporter NhaD [Bacteroidaceae bacterium]
MNTLVITIFIVGYLFIVMESVTKVNKSAIALFMGVACWVFYMLGHPGLSAEEVFLPCVGETCETILFLMGAMTIIEMVDSNGGFGFVSRYIRTTRARVLLWEVVCITFILSALLDNMTTTIIMTMMLRKLVTDRNQRLLYAGMIVIAANSGGAFSPIGDVTTIMLWIKGCVSTQGIIGNMFLPSVVSVVVPASIVTFWLEGEVKSDAIIASEEEDSIPATQYFFLLKSKHAIFFIGVVGLALVPVFHSMTGLPPFVGVLGLLSLLWIFTEMVIRNDTNPEESDSKIRVSDILRKIDMSTILFFLGILFAVGAVGETGALTWLGQWLGQVFHDDVYVINSIIGILSSVVDNVPLVASAMGMYNIEPSSATGVLQNFAQDGDFWNLLAYCAGTGGSILIIGSAAGVVIMGLERITFGWYLRRFSWLALAGYLSGIGIYYLQCHL